MNYWYSYSAKDRLRRLAENMKTARQIAEHQQKVKEQAETIEKKKRAV